MAIDMKADGGRETMIDVTEKESEEEEGLYAFGLTVMS